MNAVDGRNYVLHIVRALMCTVGFGLFLGKASVIPDDQVGDCSELRSRIADDSVPDSNVNPVLSQFS